jgi:hypothetical protein
VGEKLRKMQSWLLPAIDSFCPSSLRFGLGVGTAGWSKGLDRVGEWGRLHFTKGGQCVELLGK